jgi:hypothetical protein
LPRAFLLSRTYLHGAATHRSIVAMPGAVLENGMVPDQTNMACRRVERIIIDDRSRLPGRFFGRFATSATSELRNAL